MIDVNTTVRNYLLAQTDLTDLVGSRIYAGRSEPPAGYDVGDGPCLLFKVRDLTDDYDDALLLVQFQFQAYADSEINAFAVYRALKDVLHNGRNADVLRAISTGGGDVLEDPATQWPFVLAYYTVIIRGTGD